MFLIAKNEITVLKKVLMAVFSLIYYEPELDKYTEGDSSIFLLTEDEVVALENTRANIEALEEETVALQCFELRAIV